MVKVKICGITNAEDARAAVSAGCDALGFAFYRKSPRYLTVGKAKKIIATLPKHTIKIGVFVDATEKRIKQVARACGLDILQFHGSESVDFCDKFKKYKIIKAFRVRDAIDLENVLRYHPFAYLFDTFAPSRAGGTGKRFNWRLLKHLEGITRPIFLSGGLTEKNVRDAIRIAHPAWVDVCTGVESVPGKKDHSKVKKFISAAKTSVSHGAG